MFPDADLLKRVRRLEKRGHDQEAELLLVEEFQSVPRRHAASAAMAVADHYREQLRIDQVELWYRRGVEARTREESGDAALLLGMLRQEHGQDEGAADAYTEALAYRGGGPALAALLLADLLADAQPDAARQSLRFAAASGREAIAGPARLRLALALLDEANEWGARVLCRQTIDGGVSACADAAQAILDLIAGESDDLEALGSIIAAGLPPDFDALDDE